jgi:ribonucleoside-diphosphate reductase alpha chain
MVSDLKYFDGTLSRIDRIPADLRSIYATAFEVDPKWLVEAASRRQKWIDQAQSLNIYMGGASGKKLDEVYKLAWLRGLKTTYYLRTMAATHVEKSTVAHGALNSVSNGDGGAGGAGSGGLGVSGSGITAHVGNGVLASSAAPSAAAGAAFATAVARSVAPVAASPAIVLDASPALSDEEITGPVCMMRPGDAGFDECEACQ